MSRPGPNLVPLELTDGERSTLEGWVRRRKSARDLALRAGVVLASARTGEDGLPMPVHTVAERVGVSPGTAAAWRERFLADRLRGLTEEPPPEAPRRRSSGPARRAATRPATGTPRTARTGRAYEAVGLYLAPPERAIALHGDGASPLGAPDPDPTPGPGRAVAGGTPLLEALDATTGTVMGSLHRRRRAVEFRRFLTEVDRDTPAGLQVLLICDGHATHRAPTVQNWLRAHPRFRLHPTPAGSSWPDLAERWLARLTEAHPRGGGRRTPPVTAGDIRAWMTGWTDDPRPYARTWT